MEKRLSKVLKTAAIVVGAVALIATGIGAAAGVGALTLSAGAAATISSVATIAGVAASVLSVAAQVTAKKPSAEATGSQTQFAADPDAGIPMVLGRTGTAGNIVFRKGFNTSDAGDNDRQSFVSVLSLGPVKSIGSFTVDRVAQAFNGNGQAVGNFVGFMWMLSQLGNLPEPAALGFGAGAGSPPGWTASCKLSGKAATTWTLRFDTKAKYFQNGVPAPMWAVEGVLCYDPRKDSTYPGGSGPHRMADPADTAAYDAAVATWEYSEDPYLHGLKWAHGVWQRDKTDPTSKYQRVMGMGAPWAGIDVPAFVEGANIAQANGWKVGGVIFSGDNKWDSLKKILQAGMGEPLALGAKISCLVNAPKVSLATITTDDVIGDASVAATQPRRERINTVTPRYRLEANNWQLLPGAPISVPEYVAVDRGKRSKVLDYAFIQDAKQVATAVRYDIENAREFGPIVLPLKLFWMGYKPGDCVTAHLPELGLNGQPILLLNRELDPVSGTATMTARSETPAKHPFALGQTTTPPTTPALSGPPLVPVPAADAWDISATGIDSGGLSVPALVVTGAVDAASAEAVVFEYRPFISGQDPDAAWRAAGIETASCVRKEIASVAPSTAYEVAVSYRVRGVTGNRRILGPEATVAGYAAIIEGSVSGAGGWHRPPVIGDQYLRISNDGGVSFGAPFKVVGEDGAGFTTLINKANMSVNGGAATKVSGGGGWDGSVHSLECYAGDVQAIARIENAAYFLMVGLNSDPDTDANFTSGDHFVYCADGSFRVFENGDQRFVGGTVSSGDLVYVRRRGTTVEYGVLGEAGPRYTTTAGIDPSVNLYFDSSFYSMGASVSSVALMPLGADGRDGVDGLNGTNGLPGAPGANGAPSYVHIAYANSSNGSVDFTTGAPGSRAFIGVRTDHTAADSTTPSDYTWSLFKGADGTNGTPGAPGDDGQPSYVHFAWATAADGSTGFSTSVSSGKTYIGVYSDFIEADSPNPALYSWSLIRGADGTNGADGITPVLSKPAVLLDAFSNGTLKPGALTNAVGTLKLLQGSAVVSSGVTFSTVGSSPGGITATIDAAGAWAITGCSIDSGTFTFRATLAGQNYDLAVSVTKSKQGSAAYSKTGPISNSFNTNVYQASGSITGMPTSAGAGIQFSATVSYGVTAGSAVVIAKGQYRINGGTWTDFSGSEATGNTATASDLGNVDISGSLAAGSIPAGATIDVQVLARKSVNGGVTVTVSGEMAVAWA